MRDRLKTVAANNGRTLNAQIIHLLELALEKMGPSADPSKDDRSTQAEAEILLAAIDRNTKILERLVARFDRGGLDQD